MLNTINTIIWQIYLPQTKRSSYMITEKLLSIWRSPQMMYLLEYMQYPNKINIIIELQKILNAMNNYVQYYHEYKYNHDYNAY